MNFFTMGVQSLGAGRSILSGPGALVALTVENPTRELIVGLNEDGHRG